MNVGIREAPGDSRAVPTSLAERIRPADGLRGLAALAIVAHHASFASGKTFDDGFVADINSRLDVGVPIFFALSGFLLFEPFVRRILDGVEFPSLFRFWRRRFVRIFPAYWVALAIQLLIGAVSVIGFGGFLLNVTLTQIYAGRYAVSGISQSWSLATEIGFYALLPFVAILGRRLCRGRPAMQAIVVLVGLNLSFIALSTVTRLAFAALDLPGEANYKYVVFANADYFAVGMIFACLVVAARRSPTYAALLDTMFRRPGWWYAASFAALWFTATQLGVPRGLVTGSGEVEMARQVGYFVVAVCAVGPAVCAPADGSWSGRFLGSRPLVFLGVTSYGMYLWHQVFLSAPAPNEGLLFSWFDGWELFDAPFWPMFVLSSIGATAIGAASWYFVERPLLRRFR